MFFKRVLIILVVLFIGSTISMSAAEYNKFAENSNYNYYIEEDAANVQIESKKTGQVYSSSVNSVEGLNESYANMANSGVTIEYINDKEKVVKKSSNDDSCKMTYTYSENAVKIDLKFGVGIEFTLNIIVDEEKMTVSIPGDSIIENPEKAKLINIYVFPFLGATNDRTQDGYLFVPEGMGGVIEYDNQDIVYTTAYKQKIYGDDVGYQTGYDPDKTSYETVTNISYPVYGIVNEVNEMGFWAHIESGAENTYIQAAPAGVYTNYFWETQVFNYREEYFQKTNKKGDGSYQYPEEMLVYDASVSYYFQDEASYSSFAQGYQKYLVENKMLVEHPLPAQPLMLTVLGVEKNTSKLFGQEIVMTSFEDLTAILDDLEASGIEPVVIVEGWNKGGYLASSYDSELTKNFATEDELESYNVENPDQIYLSSNLLLSHSEQFLDASNDEAMIWYGDLYGFLMNSADVIAKMQEQSNSNINYAYSDVYQFLYSSDSGSRSEMLNSLNSLEVESTPNKTPNEYGYKNTSVYYGADLENYGYYGMSYSVPFLPMVFSGYITMYSTPLNLQSTNQDTFLKLIEYNVFPNFYITANDTYALSESNLDSVYSSEYTNFKEDIINLFTFYTPFYEATKGAEYINNQQVANGAICSYSNGVEIYVNYADSAQIINGISVEANSYEVVK